MADVGHAPQEAQMSTGDERLDAVEDRIDEAKEAADRVEDNEGLGLRHRETDQHGTFEPSGDDRNAGENPSQGRDAGAPSEASERKFEARAGTSLTTRPAAKTRRDSTSSALVP